MPINDNGAIRLSTPLPGPQSTKWMERRKAAVPRSLCVGVPALIRRASGAVLEDIDGNRILDFAGGIGSMNVGHSDPAVVEAIQQQASQFTHTCFMVSPYDGYIRLAEELNRRAPGDAAKKTMLVNSGAEAVENAIKIARSYTRRPAVIAFEDGFHGRTLLAMSLTSKTAPYKRHFGPYAPEIYRIPYAYCYRCSYNLEYPACNMHCASRMEEVFLKYVAADSVAAVIFEPVLGEGGFVLPPAEWFARIAEISAKHGILVIADEVQTGFGRTGTTFASEGVGLVPDLLVTAKSLSGGLPLGAVTGRAEIMDAAGPGELGGTFGGNPIACAAALATLSTLDASELNKKADEFGRIFVQYAERWRERFPLIGDIRGVGAMQALELVRNRATREPAKEETLNVLAACHRRGLLVLSAGTHNNVIRLLAPLVITPDQIHEGMKILEEALDETHGGLAPFTAQTTGLARDGA